MEKDMNKLLLDLQNDAALLKAFTDAKLSMDDVDGIVAFAAEHGYSISEDDIKALTRQELTPEELDAVAGGQTTFDHQTAQSLLEMMFTNPEAFKFFMRYIQDNDLDLNDAAKRMTTTIECSIYTGSFLYVDEVK